MANEEMPGKTTDTSEYSASKAPENREHVESTATTGDHRLMPGGRHGARAPVGMSELDHDKVPNEARDPQQAHYGEEPSKKR